MARRRVPKGQPKINGIGEPIPEPQRNDAQPVLGTEDPVADLDDSYSEAGIESVEPAELGTSSGTDTGDSGTRTRRKYRKRRAKAQSEISGDLVPILLSVHLMGATLINTPELVINQQEAEQLSSAITRVNELYGGIVLPEKTLAWMNLAIALGTVYGPRVVAIQRRKKLPKIKQVETQTEVILVSPGQGGVN